MPRARRSYRRFRSRAREINGVRFRRALPTDASDAHNGSLRVIRNRDGRRSFRSPARSLVRSLAPRSVPFTHSRVRLSPQFGSARLGSGSLGLAWIGLARPTTRSYAPARGDSSARERSPSESHACQRRPAQIMVGCVERRGGGCGDCGYETRGRRRSFLLAYVVSSLSLPFTRSIPLPRSLALRPRLARLAAAIA